MYFITLNYFSACKSDFNQAYYGKWKFNSICASVIKIRTHKQTNKQSLFKNWALDEQVSLKKSPYCSILPSERKFMARIIN